MLRHTTIWVLPLEIKISYDEAIEAYNKASLKAYRPGHAETHNNLGIALERTR